MTKSKHKILTSIFRSRNNCNIHEFTPHFGVVLTKLPHIFISFYHCVFLHKLAKLSLRMKKIAEIAPSLGQWSSEQKYSLSDRCRLKLKNIKIKCSLDVNFCCLLTKMISATGMGQKIRLNDFNFQFTKLPHIGFSKNRFLKASLS